MTAESHPFGFYTEEQWREIFSALSDAVDGFDEQKVRAELLTAAFSLHLRLYAPPPQYEGYFLRVAKAARHLHETIVSSETQLLRRDLLALGGLLPKLVDDIERATGAFRIESVQPRPANNVDVERNAYLRKLLSIWITTGGKLKTSANKDTGRAGGPLVRFLLAAAGPPLAASGRSITAEGLKHFAKDVRADMAS